MLLLCRSLAQPGGCRIVELTRTCYIATAFGYPLQRCGTIGSLRSFMVGQGVARM